MEFTQKLTRSPNSIPNIKALAQIIFEIFCWQGFYVKKMQKIAKGQNSVKRLQNLPKSQSNNLHLFPNQYTKH